MRRTLVATLALSLGLATPALAGPPWISLEYPVNPYSALTRGAYALVRVYHHGDPADYPLSGTAEGLVNGARRSQPLTLTPTGTPGLYALAFEPPREGHWMLFLRVGRGDDAMATLVVRLDEQGGIASARVPTHRRDGWDIPDKVTSADIERMLRDQGTPAGLLLPPLRSWRGHASLAS